MAQQRCILRLLGSGKTRKRFYK